jgi:hypothetical protein
VRIGRLGIRFQLESVVFEMMITLMCIKFGKLFFSYGMDIINLAWKMLICAHKNCGICRMKWRDSSSKVYLVNQIYFLL